jgi:quinol monooxygenase YgiN
LDEKRNPFAGPVSGPALSASPFYLLRSLVMLQRRMWFVLLLVMVAGESQLRAEEENPIVTLVKSKLSDKSKPFGMTVQFKVKEGKEKAFEEAFAPAIAGTRKEPGCLEYFLNRDVDEPSTFLVFERFKNIAALESHARTPHVAEVLKKITPLLDGDPAVKVYGIAAE